MGYSVGKNLCSLQGGFASERAERRHVKGVFIEMHRSKKKVDRAGEGKEKLFTKRSYA